MQVPAGAEGEDAAEAVRPPPRRGIHDAPLHHALSGEIVTWNNAYNQGLAKRTARADLRTHSVASDKKNRQKMVN